jgi:hypothetical protein
MIETVPTELADCVVQTEQGEPARLGDVWKKRPIVLAWVRHFG